MLHRFPAAVGKIGPEGLQLIWLPSLDDCRNEVIVPFGCTIFPLASMYGTPLGFKLRPPPLNIKVRIEGCSKMMPKPERNTVFPLPNTSQATPTRGDTLL